MNEPWFPLAHLPAQLPQRPRFWSTADFDPAPVFARVRVPTLLFYGEDDEWIPIDDSIRVWRDAARAARARDLTIVRLPGMRHEPTYGGRPDRISPDYVRALEDWTRRHVQSGAGPGPRADP